MSAKAYPLDVQSCGGDTYICYSKGHHNADAFMQAVRGEGYYWPLGYPKQSWWRTVPAPHGWTEEHGYCDSYFVEASAGAPGAYPVTVSYESYGEDRYEAVRDRLASTQDTRP